MESARQNPATIKDLPTSEPVPMIMSALAMMGGLDDVGVGAEDVFVLQSKGLKRVTQGIGRIKQRCENVWTCLVGDAKLAKKCEKLRRVCGDLI